MADSVSLAVVLLLFLAGVAPPSFLIGLWVGATVIQVYFHRFHQPLSPTTAPTQPTSPIKTMSYGADGRARRGRSHPFAVAAA